MGHVPLAEEKRIILVYHNEPPAGMFDAVRTHVRAQLPVEERAVRSGNVQELREQVRAAQRGGDIIVIEQAACGLFLGTCLRDGFIMYQLDGGEVAFSGLGGSTLSRIRKDPETVRIPLVH